MNKNLVRVGAAVLLSVVGFATAALAEVASKGRAPTAKVYVADMSGDSQIHRGTLVESLTKKSSYAAEGSILETKENGSGSLVFSNGTAIYVGPRTQLEVKKFQQESFQPNRNDLDAEPSASQTIIKITRGSVGICTSKLVAGSSMIYETPHGSVNIRGRKVMVEVSETETRVSLLEGDVTVLAAADNGQTLRPGQQAVIRKTAPDQAPSVSVQPIADEQQARLDEHVSLACLSRRTVYFEVNTRDGEAADIRPVEVVPAKPDPGFTVSPARIGG